MRFARSIVTFLFVVSSVALSAVMALANPGLVVSPIDGLTVTPLTLAQTLAGPGVVIDPLFVSYTGANGASGTFSGGTGIIGIEDGIVLTSGSATSVVGPNNNDGTFTNNDTLGDGDLEALSGVGSGMSHDAAVLEFDFTPTADTIFVSYVFSSEEYNEFSNTQFNDAFGFFVNGDGPGTGNCAIVPGTTDPVEPVSVNTINGGNPFGTNAQHPEFFINNDNSDPPNAGLDTQMDGLTTVLTCQASVTQSSTNHMKLAIADTGDFVLDSAVFLQGNSLSTTPPANVPGRPTINQALAGNGEVGLNWSPPESDGGSSITKYTVYANPCPSDGEGACVVLPNVSPTPNAPPIVEGNPTTFSYVIGGLANGTTYSFTVTASNTNGEGAPSEPATATPSGSADTTTLGANGSGTVDTGFAGGANSSDPSCATDPSSPECKNIVARYSLRDPKNAGAVIGLASVRDEDTPGGPIACLEFDFAFTVVEASEDCETVADKALLSTYPTNVGTLVRPHFAFEQNDRTVTTDVIGAPCFQLVTKANGTPFVTPNGYPICKKPNFPLFGYGPNKTNICPDGTGWTAAKPCAYVYYKVERIDGYDLAPADCLLTWPNCTWGTLASPKARRPVQCEPPPEPLPTTCGKEVIIGSSIVAGIKLANGQYAVRPWCTGSWGEGQSPPSNIKWLPCDLFVVWLNFVSSSSVHYLDVLWTDLEVNDPGGKRTG